MAAMLPIPGRGVILVSHGMCDRLTPQELQAVLLHEMAHGLEGLGIVGGTVVSLLLIYLIYTYWMQPTWPPLAEPSLWLGWGWVCLSMLHARRTSEFRADATAVLWMGNDKALRSALLVVEPQNQTTPTRWWHVYFSPHPTTAARLKALDQLHATQPSVPSTSP